jgi:hypothetical protein
MPKGVPATGKHVKRADDRRATRPVVIDENQLYSIKEAAAARDMSPTQLSREIAAGNVRGSRDGSRVKVSGTEIIRLNRGIAGLPSAAAGEQPDHLAEKLRALGYEIKSPEVRQAVERLRALGYTIKEPKPSSEIRAYGLTIAPVAAVRK